MNTPTIHGFNLKLIYIYDRLIKTTFYMFDFHRFFYLFLLLPDIII